MDGSGRILTTTTVGFSLLPSDLIQYIFFKLSLPDILRIKFVNKSILTAISDKDFVRNYNLHSSSATWLFIYKKFWQRDSVLDGFTDCSNRWFKIMIMSMLKDIVPPKESLYFLTASGNYFLFVLYPSQEVISVNPSTKTVIKIPRSPLRPYGPVGPLDMFSRWRSRIKLLSDRESSYFKFLFAEMVEGIPILFEYNSETDKWRSMKAKEIDGNLPSGNKKENGFTFLNASNRSTGCVIIAVGSSVSDMDTPVVVRPRYDVPIPMSEEGDLAVGFGSGNVIDRMQVYGDGRMLIVRSSNMVVDGQDERSRVLKGVELWGLSPNGGEWAFMSKVPNGLIDKIKKPYKVIMGCLEDRQGTIKAVLLSNYKGVWDTIWLCYDVEKRCWNWVPLPDCKMKGNISGITFSSGLTLSRSTF